MRAGSHELGRWFARISAAAAGMEALAVALSTALRYDLSDRAAWATAAFGATCGACSIVVREFRHRGGRPTGRRTAIKDRNFEQAATSLDIVAFLTLLATGSLAIARHTTFADASKVTSVVGSILGLILLVANGGRGSGPLKVGALAGRWRVRHPLAEGGMSYTYLARRGIQQGVLKVPQPKFDNAQVRERFRREAKILTDVQHANIVRMLDHGERNGTPYIVTEFADGPTLEDFVSNRHVVPIASAVPLGLQMAEALEVAHAAGVTHRDINPSNIVLTRQGPRLIDFGIAAPASVSRLTARREELGTLQYLAPEQFLGSEQTPGIEPGVGTPADIFSWALSLSVAVCGQHPFGWAEDHDLYREKVLEADPDLSAIPNSLREVIRHCLNKTASLRPTAAILVAHLRTIAQPTAPFAFVGTNHQKVQWRRTYINRLIVMALSVAGVLILVTALRNAIIPPVTTVAQATTIAPGATVTDPTTSRPATPVAPTTSGAPATLATGETTTLPTSTTTTSTGETTVPTSVAPTRTVAPTDPAANPTISPATAASTSPTVLAVTATETTTTTTTVATTTTAPATTTTVTPIAIVPTTTTSTSTTLPGPRSVTIQEGALIFSNSGCGGPSTCRMVNVTTTLFNFADGFHEVVCYSKILDGVWGQYFSGSVSKFPADICPHTTPKLRLDIYVTVDGVASNIINY
jgi:serine/threonine protein kinase